MADQRDGIYRQKRLGEMKQGASRLVVSVTSHLGNLGIWLLPLFWFLRRADLKINSLGFGLVMWNLISLSDSILG